MSRNDMSRLVGLTLISVFLFASPPGELFDDFNYNDTGDTLLLAHGWNIVNGKNAPPAGAQYDRSLINFMSDPEDPDRSWITLDAVAGESNDSMRLSRIESSDKFYEGTYAARVFFDHALRKSRDGNIQAFYLITPLDYPNDTLYSECDFEYLPYDIWDPGNNKRSAVYASTWDSYQPEPFIPDHAFSSKKQNLYGWHTLIIVVMGGEVRYHIDKDDKPFAVHRYSDKGSSVYPESPMQVAFANWISLVSEKSKDRRSSTMKVDWFYHVPDTVLYFYEIMERVNAFRKNSIDFINTGN